MKSLDLEKNALTSLPGAIGTLTALTELVVRDNLLTKLPRAMADLTSLESFDARNNNLVDVPTNFRKVDPNRCLLSGNPADGDPGAFSCANVGFDTTCCTAANCGDVLTCRGAPVPDCSDADTTCNVGATCRGGTVVSARCADRSAFDESPCACTALQQLAALSDTLQAEAPWNALRGSAYCQTESGLAVTCETVDGVQLPERVEGQGAGLAGALPPSVGELRSSLRLLDLDENAITSLPTELGALTGLVELDLFNNTIAELPTEIGALTNLLRLSLQRNAISEVPTELALINDLNYLRLNGNDLTGVPVEFRTFDPSIVCRLFDAIPGNPLPASESFSCANVGFTTSCCDQQNCGDTSTCYGSTCTYADLACVAGSICPGGTAVSAECADRSAFDESPCACTALQELAALSDTLQAKAPWNDLANEAYCESTSPAVTCTSVDGMQLPERVDAQKQGLAGKLQRSLGELGPSLTYLRLRSNAITSVPTELGALTGLKQLDLGLNALTSLPTEFWALTGLTTLELSGNAFTSLPSDVGALTGLRNLWGAANNLPSLPTEIGALTGLTWLYMSKNNITAVPSELAALTNMLYFDLDDNQLTGFPTEFRTWGGPVGDYNRCALFDNPGFSCANVRADTSCCTGDVYLGNGCGEGLPGGPCYTG